MVNEDFLRRTIQENIKEIHGIDSDKISITIEQTKNQCYVDITIREI